MKVDFPDSPVPRIVNKQLNNMQTNECQNSRIFRVTIIFCEIIGRDEFQLVDVYNRPFDNFKGSEFQFWWICATFSIEIHQYM